LPTTELIYITCNQRLSCPSATRRYTWAIGDITVTSREAYMCSSRSKSAVPPSGCRTGLISGSPISIRAPGPLVRVRTGTKARARRCLAAQEACPARAVQVLRRDISAGRPVARSSSQAFAAMPRPGLRLGSTIRMEIARSGLRM
jgi:hypothetical protein